MRRDVGAKGTRAKPQAAAARVAACGLALVGILASTAHADPWPRHTIDNTSRGADGVRMMDVNGDGHLDIATGWEEGGVIRVYLNPGHGKSKAPWPAVTVGRVKSAEDAVFVDLDQDGAVDVVSSCEGGTRTMYVHWAPKDKANYLDENAWTTEPIPATAGKQLWMFCLPMQIDGKHGPDLIVGSKGGDGAIGWLQAPADARDLDRWRYHRLRDVGWIMSLIARDMDGDGDDDVLYSDRKGPKRGVGWLENPGPARAGSLRPWTDHVIGATDREVMFIDPQPVAAVKAAELIAFQRDANGAWQSRTIAYPPEMGGAKAVRVGDIDLDGRPDLVMTCEHATKPKSGVKWMSMSGGVGHDIAGPAGVKFDRIELVDLDGDGDLDVITCEERDQLGVIWYENPTR